MKSSFASINYGRVQYLGKNEINLSFFDINYFKADDIYSTCLLVHKGKSMTFTQLWEEIVEDVAYTQKDLNEALVELEKSSKIAMTRISSKRCSYKDKDIIKVLQ